MSRAVLPRRSARSEWLLRGRSELPVASVREPQLDDDAGDDTCSDDDTEHEAEADDAAPGDVVMAATAAGAESLGDDVDMEELGSCSAAVLAPA